MKTTTIALLASLALGCGGPRATPDPDAGLDVSVDPTAERDIAPEVPTGTVADFGTCRSPTDCINPNSQCILVTLTGASECLPQCTATATCPFNTYCYPVGGGTVLGQSVAAMANHCWYSICGELEMNGTTGGACMLGAESGATAANQLPGWCLPIDDGVFGQCLEAGTVAPGGACNFTAGTQTRGGANCDATSLCVGMAGAAMGTCAQVCNPANILTGTPTGCTVATEGCFDSSSVITQVSAMGAVMVNRQTIGFCAAGAVPCGLIGTLNACPNDATGAAQGCVQTNSLRPTGICDPMGAGVLTAGTMCVAPTPATPDTGRCAAGTLCNGAAAAMTCQTFCTTAPPTCTATAPCPAPMTCPTPGSACAVPYPVENCAALGLTCRSLVWDTGFDMTPGTPDDNHTADWGTCQP